MSNASKNCLHKRCPSMEDDLKKAAAEGKFDPFKEHLDHLDCIVTYNENTILHVHLSLLKERSTEFIKQVVGTCPKLLTQENRDGNTPLHIAARHGHTDAAEELIRQAEALDGDNIEAVREKLREKLRKENKKKETALHVAARNGRSVGVVKAILSKEDPHHKYPPNKNNETPLYLAVDNTCTNIVAELLNHFSSESLDLDSDGHDKVMHTAVRRWSTEIVSLLLKKESSLAKKPTYYGWTPLHTAADEGWSSMVATLLDMDKSIAGCITGDVWEMTALHLAAVRGFKHAMNEIISKCPDSCKITCSKGRNVLHYATLSENDEVLQAILETPSLVYLINGKDHGGNTPVHLFKALNLPLPSFIVDGNTDGFILWNKLYNEIPGDFRVEDLAKAIPYFQNLTPADKEIMDEYAQDEYFWEVSAVIYTMAESKTEEFIHEENKILLGGKKTEEFTHEEYKILVEGKKPEKLMNRRLKKREEMIIDKLEKAKDSHLVVAALVATVTFAAAFTLPGGYISDKDDAANGTPILSRSSAFKAFVISDTIAMALSISSVFVYFISVMLGYGPKYYWLIRTAFRFIFLAMGAMVVAFVTGTYAVLAPFSGLAVATCVIGLSFFIFLFYILLRLIYDFHPAGDANGRDDSITRILTISWISCGGWWLKNYISKKI